MNTIIYLQSSVHTNPPVYLNIQVRYALKSCILDGSLDSHNFRNDQLITATGNTRIKSGDFLYILASKSSKPKLKQNLQGTRSIYQSV